MQIQYSIVLMVISHEISAQALPDTVLYSPSGIVGMYPVQYRVYKNFVTVLNTFDLITH